MKRSINGFLAVVLALSVVMTACGGGSTKKNDNPSPQAKTVENIVTEPGTYPIVQDKYNVRVFTKQSPLIENMETNEFTVNYEKKSNVHVIWELVPENALEERRKLSLSSGDWPHVYMAANVKKEEEIAYGSQGLFLPLNDLIEKYTVGTKKSVLENLAVRDQITAPDGKIYALPFIEGAVHARYATKLWINTKWLKKLDLQVPKTTEEFYHVMKAFKEKDPNGNGKKDEIPFMSEKINAAGSGFYDFFMNSFIGYSTDKMYVSNGKIDVAFNKPEWKKGLEYLKKLYSEGLIDNTSLTAEAQQVKQIAEKADAEVLGAFVALQPGTYYNLTGERHKNFDSIPPLKGPDGVQYALYNPYNCSSGQFAITKACKNPEVAIRWTDYFFTLEGGLSSRIGREGQEWRKANPGERSYTGETATWAKVKPIGIANNFFWAGLGQAMDWSLHPQQASEQDIYNPNGLERRLYEATKANYMPYGTKDPIPPLYIPSEDLKKILQNNVDIRNYYLEHMVRFVTGDMDLGRDWDKYTKNFENMGLKNVLEVYQKAYDTYLKNKKSK